MEESIGKALVNGAVARAGAAAAAVADSVGSVPTSMFVINLCASMAPVQVPGKALPGLEGFRLYQVSRAEDGRTRYRLRLGFFMSEAHADSVLASVREQYPTAFTTCICDEDRRFARGYLPENRVPPAAPTAPARPEPVAAAPASRPAPASSPAADPSATNRVRALQVVPSTPKVPAQPVNAAPPNAAAPQPEVKREPAPVRPAAVTSEPEAAPRKPAAAQPKAPEAKPDSSTTGSFRVAAAANGSTGSFKAASATGSFKLSETGAFSTAASARPEPTQPDTTATGSFKASPSLSSTGSFKAAAVAANGSLKALAASRAASISNPPPAPEAVPPAIAARSSTPSPVIELTLDDDIPLIPDEQANGPAQQPFHVGKGVSIPGSSLSLDGEAQAPRAANAGPATRPPAAAAKPSAPVSAAPAARPAAPAPSKPEPNNALALGRLNAKPAAAPDFDSTQTIRPLSADELGDESQEKWFAIQLAVSEQPVNLEAMPHLDIFEAYQLYSVAGSNAGKTSHSLRLGFFRESISADAVSGYLKAFFPATTVVRISGAEYTRFSSAPLRQAPEGPGRPDKVIELSEASKPAPKLAIPTVTLEVPRSISSPMLDPSNSGSYKVSQSGKFKALKSASKSAAPAVKRAKSEPADRLVATGKQQATKHTSTGKFLATGKHSATGKHLATGKHTATGKQKATSRGSLRDELMAEARQTALSESAIRKLPKNNSLLSRLVDKLTK